MGWYAIHVRTGSEDAVCETIRQQVARMGYVGEFELLVPKRKLQERHQGKFIEVVRTMFPGYVLVQSEEIRELAEVAARAKGILRFLQNEGEFQEVNPAEIIAVLELVNDEGLIECSVVEIEDGLVRVVSGPLKGHEGWIRKVDLHHRRVQVKFLFSNERYLIDLEIRCNQICKSA